MKKIAHHILLIACLTCSAFFVNAQSIHADINKNSILTGEYIKLTLTAEDIDTKKTLLTQWIQFPDSSAHFEIIERSKIDTVISNQKTSYQQTLTITSFDSGSWQIPSLKIILKNKQGNHSITKNTLPITVTVAPPDISKLKDIHDVSDIITATASSNNSLQTKKPVTIIIIAALFIIILIAWMIKRKKKVPQENKPVINAYRWATKQFDALEKKEVHNDLSARLYYDELYQICRQYVAIEFSKPVLFYTTREWIPVIQSLAIDKSTAKELYDFLLQLDQLRFSQEIIIDKTYSKQLLKSARKIINHLSKAKHANQPGS